MDFALCPRAGPPGRHAAAGARSCSPLPHAGESGGAAVEDSRKTRKGGWPLAVEKRGGGKEVTILRNASGDLKTLLRELQKTCGAGGTAREDAVEYQGNHIPAITRFLDSRSAVAP